MQRFLPYAFRFLLVLIGLTAMTVAASAQSSLVFRDAAGRSVEFTNFGTIVYPEQNVVSRGYQLVYDDGASLKRAWFFNGANNFGIVPVSLTADRPNGSVLGAGEVVYVRARMKTADDKLEIICRYIMRGGAPGIDVVATVLNTSNTSVDVPEFSFTTPVAYECQCPCEPIRGFDGASIQSSIVTMAPNMKYRYTKAIFSAPTLSRGASRDLPGCDPKPPIDFLPIR